MYIDSIVVLLSYLTFFSASIFANPEHDFSGEELDHHFPRTNGHHLTLHDQKSFIKNNNNNNNNNSNIKQQQFRMILKLPKKNFSSQQQKNILNCYNNSASFAVARLSRGLSYKINFVFKKD